MISKKEAIRIQGDKCKFALWLNPATKELVRSRYRQHNCHSQSEFIEKAIRFYCDYLAAENLDSYLPGVLAAALEGHLNLFGDRLGKLLYRQSVELAVLSHIIAWDTDISPEELKSLRDSCAQQVNRTKGQLSFRDALRFQKE